MGSRQGELQDLEKTSLPAGRILYILSISKRDSLKSQGFCRITRRFQGDGLDLWGPWFAADGSVVGTPPQPWAALRCPLAAKQLVAWTVMAVLFVRNRRTTFPALSHFQSSSVVVGVLGWPGPKLWGQVRFPMVWCVQVRFACLHTSQSVPGCRAPFADFHEMQCAIQQTLSLMTDNHVRK